MVSPTPVENWGIDSARGTASVVLVRADGPMPDVVLRADGRMPVVDAGSGRGTSTDTNRDRMPWQTARRRPLTVTARQGVTSCAVFAPRARHCNPVGAALTGFGVVVGHRTADDLANPRIRVPDGAQSG